jgi:hypothetical protein
MKIITPLLIALALTACSGEDSTATEPAPGNGANTQSGSSTSETKSVSDLRSSDRLKESIVKSMAADWNITQEDARCLLRDHRASQLGRAASDPEIQAVFKQCGVDPSVVK